VSVALFSIIAFISLIPCGIEHVLEVGFFDAVCDVGCKYRYPAEAVRWVFYFNLSKLFEWCDTFFVVLRKRPLIFLHYYHHIYTFLFCWYGTHTLSSHTHTLSLSLTLLSPYVYATH
jgi:elongation of very long chain fatty acids protein 6